MSRYSQRSPMTELIDAPDIPFKDWSACLRELNTINTWLGGHAITIKGLRQLVPKHKNKIVIAEIGCGGGDNLKAIHQWNQKAMLPLQYIGIDLNQACVEFARSNCDHLPIARFIHSDYREAQFNDTPPDIIFSSLFCHHFTDNQLVEMLVWLKNNTTTGFFINDLQRHPIAFHSIKWLTQAFSRSYLVKHDAPISVMRGFLKKEWQQLLHRAGIENYTIQWQWAFRYLITVKHKH